MSLRAVAEAGASIGIVDQQFDLAVGLPEPIQPDQLQRAGSHRKLVVAADLVVPAVHGGPAMRPKPLGEVHEFEVIEKPYGRVALADRVRAILDREPPRRRFEPVDAGRGGRGSSSRSPP